MENKIPQEVQSLINKAKLDGHSVFALTISGVKYIYRSINRAEFRELQEVLTKEAEALRIEGEEKKKDLKEKDPKLTEIDLYIQRQAALIRENGEERLVAKALLHPKLTEGTPAGVAPTLADRIMEGSGFTTDSPEPEIL